MEWTALISPIVSAIIAILGAYFGAKKATDEKLREAQQNIAELRVEIKHLTAEVEKHNKVIERTYKLETEVDNLYHRYAELHDDYKTLKIGGTE